jgi:hypothetical protein
MITNYLSTTGFIIKVSRLPNVEFFSQKFLLPGVNANPVETQTPLRPFYNVPDHMRYTDLDLTFIVDENMANYREIFDWIVGMGTPDTLDQYRKLKESKEGLVSDVTVLILNSNKNPNIKITFINAFPIGLTPVSFDVSQQDVIYAEASVTMRYDAFTIEKL